MVSRYCQKHIKMKILIQTVFSIVELQKLHGLEMHDRVLENYGLVAFGKFQFSLASFDILASEFFFKLFVGACGLHVFQFFKERDVLGMTRANMADVDAIESIEEELHSFFFFFFFFTGFDDILQQVDSCSAVLTTLRLNTDLERKLEDYVTILFGIICQLEIGEDIQSNETTFAYFRKGYMNYRVWKARNDIRSNKYGTVMVIMFLLRRQVVDP